MTQFININGTRVNVAHIRSIAPTNDDGDEVFVDYAGGRAWLEGQAAKDLLSAVEKLTVITIDQKNRAEMIDHIDSALARIDRVNRDKVDIDGLPVQIPRPAIKNEPDIYLTQHDNGKNVYYIRKKTDGLYPYLKNVSWDDWPEWTTDIDEAWRFTDEGVLNAADIITQLTAEQQSGLSKHTLIKFWSKEAGFNYVIWARGVARFIWVDEFKRRYVILPQKAYPLVNVLNAMAMAKQLENLNS